MSPPTPTGTGRGRPNSDVFVDLAFGQAASPDSEDHL